MKKHKKYTDYFIEECDCGKRVTGNTEKQCRHNFATHLVAEHGVTREKARTYKVKNRLGKIAISFLLSGVCIVTLGTNWLIPGILAWGFSSFSFSQTAWLQLDKLKEKFDIWRLS